MSGGTMISQGQKSITKNRIYLVMFIVGYDFDNFLVTNSVPAGNRVNGAYCSYFLEHHLRPAVHRKHPNLLNSHPIVLNNGACSHKATPVINLWYFTDGTEKF